MLIFMLAAGIGTYMTVHLLIRGENKVVVPALVGKEVVHALEVLSDLGLNTKVKGSQFSPSVPKHHIIAQDPEPGNEIKRGRDVRLVISRGARTVIYPNLAGIDLPQAQILLEQNGLRQGYLSHAYHQDRPEQEIVTQFPPSGSRGLRGDTIDLLVSAGPAPISIRMFDLKGMDLNQAITIVEKARLAVGNISAVIDPTADDDTILSQSPGAGYRVNLGAQVDITISRQAPRRTGIRHGSAQLYRYRVASGFLRQQVRIRINRPNATFDIFNAFVKPGTEIWLLVPRDVATTLFLYLDGELAKTEHYD
jgi:serine/threonine-protein kinase